METLEFCLLGVAYTLLIITIFVQYLCYRRNMETLEAIGFTLSLLLLILSMSISSLLTTSLPVEHTNVFTLLAMILVGLMTPLSILAERVHRISSFWIKTLKGVAAILTLTVGVTYLNGIPEVVEYAVVVFLGTTVALSMLLIRLTAPKFTVAHREKVERVFALVFLLVVPLSLVVNYLPAAAELKVGFTLPLVFILLAGNKLFDDLQRLSLLKPGLDHKVQHFQNYAISKREKEVALLLLEGKTYRQISDCLHISMPTVKTHASRIYRKCGVNNRSELTVLLIS